MTTLALELDLDTAGQDAFLRLAAALPAMSGEFADLSKSLADLDDLVIEPAVKGVGSHGSVDELVADLETLAAQVRDEATKGRIHLALKKLHAYRAWRQKIDADSPSGLGSFEVPQTEPVGIFLPVPPSLAIQFPPTPEDPSPKHATMLYVGPCTVEDFAAVIRAVARVAERVKPFQITMDSYGEFMDVLTGKTIPHMVPEVDGVPGFTLGMLHAKIREAVELAIGRACEHRPGPFKAHVTLAYQDPGSKYDGPRPIGSFVANTLEVWGMMGGVFGRAVVSLGSSATTIKPPPTPRPGHEEPAVAEKAAEVRILSKAVEERTVLGIVLEPETVDAQADIYSEAEIQRTAWRFMERYQQFGLMHQSIQPTILPLESYIAPVDFSLNGQKVKRGTWLLRVRVLDDGIWDDVKSGRLTGFSIGGSAIRRPEKRAA